MVGKGDRNRTTDRVKFREHYDHIDWGDTVCQDEDIQAAETEEIVVRQD